MTCRPGAAVREGEKMTGARRAGASGADLAQQLAEATRRAEILRAVVESISGDLALEPVLARILESAVALLGARHGGIGLTFPTLHGTGIRPVAAYNLPPRPPGGDLPPVRGLSGRVLAEGQPVRLDRYGDLDHLARPEIADHAALAVPIWWSGRIAGVLAVTAPPPSRFDDEAEQTLALFAQHAAIAVEIARQVDRERRRAARTAVLNRIGRLIAGTLNLDEVLNTALAALADDFNYHTIAVMLVDPADPETLVTRARGGIYLDSVRVGYRQSIHAGIAGAAARARRHLLVNDVRSDPRYIAVPGGEELVAELAIPLLFGDRLVGLLNVEAAQPIGEEDAADLEIVAAQLAVAIENARLFGDTRAALSDLRLLYETSRDVSAALDEDGIIRAYLEQVAIRGRYGCGVALYEYDDGGALTAVVVRGGLSPQRNLTLGVERRPTSGEPYVAELAAGRTVMITDFRTDSRVSEEFRRFHLAHGTQPSLALIPLMVGGRLIGVVALASDVAQDWQDADVHPYQVTAAHLAAALDSSAQRRRLAERGRQLAVLEERQRLARELHDSVTQTVFGASLLAESLALGQRRDPDQDAARLGRLIALNRSALAELRALVAELRPADADGPSSPSTSDDGPPAALIRVQRDGLAAALTQHAAEMADDGPEVVVAADTYIQQAPDREQALFRIAQEALHNAVKYARAHRVLVTLATEGDRVCLAVRDDGIGFVVLAAAAVKRAGTREGGHGLAIMRERAEALGGGLRLDSTPAAGTVVETWAPRKDR